MHPLALPPCLLTRQFTRIYGRRVSRAVDGSHCRCVSMLRVLHDALRLTRLPRFNHTTENHVHLEVGEASRLLPRTSI